MKQSFWQRLRNVKAGDLLHVLLFLLALLPALLYRLTHRPFWLICEYENEARDNAYYFFRHMRREHPDVDAVYAIGRRSPDLGRVKELGKTVTYGSFAHWVLYLAAQVNISSQKGGKPNAAVCYVLEVYGILRNRRVFLQHGIINNDLPYVHYRNARFSLFTVSTKQEYEFVNSSFGYPPGVVQELGLCRFDDLEDTSRGDCILVVPTWRQWIYKGEEGARDERFTETEYFQTWNAFLNSPELDALLREAGLRLCFYPHRNMQRFLPDFRVDSPRIQVLGFPTDLHELLKQGSLLITDYSSVGMDFAYMDKPVLYYQFDRERFHRDHLTEGYFRYERDGFGEVLETQEELLACLRRYADGGFAPGKEYQARIGRFFDLRDRNNSERTYRAICRLLKK